MVHESRIGSDGFCEYLIEELEESKACHTYTILLPENCTAGQQISFARRTVNPSPVHLGCARGKAERAPESARPRCRRWRPFSTEIDLSKVIENEIRNEQLQRREQQAELEVRQWLNGLIMHLEREERFQQHHAYRMYERGAAQEPLQSHGWEYATSLQPMGAQQQFHDPVAIFPPQHQQALQPPLVSSQWACDGQAVATPVVTAAAVPLPTVQQPWEHASAVQPSWEQMAPAPWKMPTSPSPLVLGGAQSLPHRPIGCWNQGMAIAQQYRPSGSTRPDELPMYASPPPLSEARCLCARHLTSPLARGDLYLVSRRTFQSASTEWLSWNYLEDSFDNAAFSSLGGSCGGSGRNLTRADSSNGNGDFFTAPKAKSGARAELRDSPPVASEAEKEAKSVAFEVSRVLDSIVNKVERAALAEQTRIEREIERREREIERRHLQQQRALQKQQRDIEREVLACVQKMVRKLERDHALERDEDGQLFISDAKAASGAKMQVFKVRGAPCAEFFEGMLPSSAKSIRAEQAVRAARYEDLALRRPPTLSWIDPGLLGKPWTRLTMRRTMK